MYKHLLRFPLIPLLLLAWPIPAYPAHTSGVIRYAAPTAVGSGNCSNWSNACTLQYALSQANGGDQIWVKAGAHYPGTTLTATFTLKSNVTIYGGFAGTPGTEGNFGARNWRTYKTILSGDVDGDDTNTDGNYIAETFSDILGNNAYHVVTVSGTNSSAVLDGFVITAGQASGNSAYDKRGGGMYNSNSSPILRNLTFSGNLAMQTGGGMYNIGSGPTLINVIFSGNYSHDGGGIYNFGSGPTLINVIFSGNIASRNGGGMLDFLGSSPTLINVTFSSNTAAENGGGMYNFWDSNPMLTNVIFWGNVSGSGNASIHNEFNSHPTISYSILQGGCTLDINCGSGMLYSADPLFVDADGADNIFGTPDDNLRLRLNSPAIDAGNNNVSGLSGATADLGGTPRFVDIPTVPNTGNGSPPIVDMGAYEAMLQVFTPLVVRNN